MPESGGALSTLNTAASAASALIAAFIAFQTVNLKVKQEEIKTAQNDILRQQDQIKTAQEEIKRRAQAEALTHTFVDKLSEQVKQLHLKEDRQKDAIIIDMIDIITQANASQTGDVRDAYRRREIPLRLALLAGDDETLAHIGGATSKRRVWLRLARASASSRVRETALRALGHLARVADSRDIAPAIGDMLELSEHLRRVDLLDAGLTAIESTIDVLSKEPTRFREEPSVRMMVQDLRATTVSANAVRVDYGTTVSNTSSREIAHAGQVESLLKRLDAAGLVEVAAGMPVQPVPTADSAAAIGKLASDVVQERRTARAELAASGAGILPALAKELRDSAGREDAYRIKIGVVTALFQMQQPVVIANPEDAATIVALIGDDDALVRQYASEFLMKLYDPASVRLVHEALSRYLKQRNLAAGTATYNAVVVLGTWLRILPTRLDGERTAIRSELQAFQKSLGSDPQWRRTRTLTAEMLNRAAQS
jgi:hypothetical protein